MVKVIESRLEIPTKGKVLLDFYADWCGPCSRIAPMFAKLAELYPEVVFLKANVDDIPELSDEFGVTVLPTFVFLKDGVVFHRTEGADIQSLGKILETF